MLTNNNLPLEKRIDLNPIEKRLWRTLIRVDSINYSTNKIGFIIPGWNVNKVLYFDIKKIPEPLLQEIRKETDSYYRFHASVNIGAHKPEDIYIMFLDNL